MSNKMMSHSIATFWSMCEHYLDKTVLDYRPNHSRTRECVRLHTVIHTLLNKCLTDRLQIEQIRSDWKCKISDDRVKQNEKRNSIE